MEFTAAATFDAIAASTVNLDHFANEVGLSGKQQYGLGLVYEELLTNIAKYSFDQDASKHLITVNLTMDGADCVFTMKHDGKKFNPWLQEEPDLDVSLEDRNEGGIGIFLVRQFSKKYTYEYKDGINIISVII